MSFFGKVYLIVVLLIVIVVGLAEGLLEPMGKHLLKGVAGGFKPRHEVLSWAFSILIPTLACGYVLSKMLSERLGRMAKVAKAFGRGNFEVRLPVMDNSKDDFDILARSFNEMAGAVERLLQNERRLLADISHEIRSPLTRLGMAAPLLREAKDEAERSELLNRLEKDLEQLNEIAEALLAQARDTLVNSGQMAEVDLGRLLTDLADDFSFQGEAAAKKVRTVMTGNLRVFGKLFLLQRVFGNILSNALFHTPPGSAILVVAEEGGGEIFVRIRDFGPGVPEDQLEDIFRAFYRVDDSRTRSSGGAGLGLALAREAVLFHGGSIEARNAGPGLEVSVILPAHAPDVA